MPERAWSEPPTSEPTEDIVGEREKLLTIGMLAVFVACVVFGALRLAVRLASGKATPWWGNVGAAVFLGVLYLWYRVAPEKRSTVAVHGTALAATVALLVPAAYGMASSKWWLSLVAFSVMLMGRRIEAIFWSIAILVLMPLTAAIEPRLTVANAVGEPLVERAMAGFVYLALLLSVTWSFRRVVERRARQLAAAADSLRRANQVKSRFLAHMSHEIRTPLHGVIAMTDLAKAGEASGAVREQIDSAERSARALLALLNNVLDVTRAEADAIELDRRPFRLHAVLTDLLRPLAAQAQARGLDLRARAAPGIVELRVGDRVRVGQILMNLAGNAMKFTKAGRVSVRLDAVADEPDAIELSVSDTGVGIAKDKLEAVFEPFVQASAADAQVQGGAGLGLAIVRELARCMRGAVRVESELGKGSTFHVRLALPRARDEQGELAHQAGPVELLPPEGGPIATPMPRPRRLLRVLAAEDNPVNQHALTLMLERLGHSAKVVADGLAAWDALQSERFDVLLTDVEMPGLDGVELTRKLRAHERATATARLPIVGATAHVGEAENHRLLEAGMDEHLGKPFNLADLATVLERATRAVRAPDATRTIPSEPPPAVRPSVFDPVAVRELVPLDGEDRSEGLAVLGGLAEQFRAEGLRAVAEMRARLAAGEHTQAARAAHSLKGAALTLGFARVAELARRIELDAKAGVASEGVERLPVEIERAASALAKHAGELAT